jgi:ribonuclease J
MKLPSMNFTNPGSNKQLSFIALGGVGNVTRNMYVYECGDEILLVDCGLGFADETMVGVDLLLPDISYLLQSKKRIVGMLLTHGHEDHIGAVPFILPQLPQFPVYATPLTAAFTNEKLKEFALPQRVETVEFDKPTRRLGSFGATFIRLTHSVPDTANILINTPVGNFYHGSDFKFDLTPADGKKTDFTSIARAGDLGIVALMSDCLGSERPGHTPSEASLTESFEKEVRITKGKVLITTYSSNISRLNQAIEVAQKLNRRICFIGRSLIKSKDVALRLGYMKFRQGMEVPLDQLSKYPDNQLLLFVAGSQGQENSALTRIANGEHREVTLKPDDVVIFSSDPIPGNEVSVNSVIDAIAKKGARAVYTSFNSLFHVSGHGSIEELLLMISLTKPRFLVPIGGQYRHMVAYQKLAMQMGYRKEDTLLLDGKEIVFGNNSARIGKMIPTRNIYVDEVSGGELEHYVLRDRQKLVEGGIMVVMVEIDSETGELIQAPDVLTRGFTIPDHAKFVSKLHTDIKNALGANKGRVTNWAFMRKRIADVSEKKIFQEIRRRPLVLPLVIEA